MCPSFKTLYIVSWNQKPTKQTKRQRNYSRQIFTFVNQDGKGLGLIPERSHLRQGNCQEREKVNHFQKPHCSKSWSKTTVLSAKYSIWQSKSWKSTKAISPIGLGRRFILQLFFCESSPRVWLRPFCPRINGWAGSRTHNWGYITV